LIFHFLFIFKGVQEGFAVSDAGVRFFAEVYLFIGAQEGFALSYFKTCVSVRSVSYLLLSSGVKAHIDSPAYYFSDTIHFANENILINFKLLDKFYFNISTGRVALSASALVMLRCVRL
jgi:hypothetical protein